MDLYMSLGHPHAIFHWDSHVPVGHQCATGTPMCHQATHVHWDPTCHWDGPPCATGTPMCHWDTNMTLGHPRAILFQWDPHMTSGPPCATRPPMCHWDPHVPMGPPCANGTPMCHRDPHTAVGPGTTLRPRVPPGPPQPPPTPLLQHDGTRGGRRFRAAPTWGGPKGAAELRDPPSPTQHPRGMGGGRWAASPAPQKDGTPRPPRRDAAGGVGCAQSGGVGGVRPPAE